jgi:predicted DNA-binding transcriptional regulator AlpA
MTRALSESRPVPRRGLSRDEAAQYCGLGTTLFDALVADGTMPKPAQIRGRKIWDIRKLDVALDELFSDTNSGSTWADA